jgi:predicted dehydrogenase
MELRQGGGEGLRCHFVDLLSHLAGAPTRAIHAFAVPQPERPLGCSDSLVASLSFANGAVGSVVYSGGGDSRLPKERVEAFGGGLAAVLDDFRRLALFRGGRRSVVKSARDKGHRAELEQFLAIVRGEAEPVPVESYLASTRATLALAESLRTGEAVVFP